MSTPNPNYQFGQPKWKREGWYSPTQQHKPKLTDSPEEAQDSTPDPVPSSDLQFNGVDLVSAPDGYLLVTSLKKAGGGPTKLAFSRWAISVEGRRSLNTTARQCGLQPEQLWRPESQRTTWVHPKVALEFSRAFSRELYEYLKSAAPDPVPTLATVAAIATPPTFATAPDSTVRELESKVERLEDLVERLLTRVRTLESQPKALAPQPAPPKRSHYSVAAWIALKGLSVGNRGEAGIALTKYCKARNIGYRRVETESGPYTHINEYPIEVLETLDWSLY